MGISSVSFQRNGKSSSHVNPGAFSESVFSSGSGGFSSSNKGIILGDSRGGDSNKIYVISSAREAEDIFKSGNLLDGIRMAFNPGGGYSPQYIFAMSINDKKKAKIDITMEGQVIFTIKAKEYGIDGNKISVKIYNDNNITKVSVKNGYDIVLSDKVINFPILNISPKGDAVKAINIDSKKVKISITPTGGQAIIKEYSFDLYKKLGELVDTINDECSAHLEIEYRGNATKEMSVVILDFFEGVITGDTTITGNFQNLIDTLNSLGIIECEIINKRIIGNYNDPDFIYLAGGTLGEYTAQEFIKALEILEKIDVQFITTTSSSPIAHGLIKQHCVNMSSRSKKAERQFLVGHDLGVSVESIMEQAKILNSEFGALLSPGFYDYDYSDISRNKIKSYSASFYACKELGRQIAMPINEPATKKEVEHLGWEVIYSDTDIDKLISNGVWVGERARTGVNRNARSITTTREDNLLMVEFSIMRETLFMNRDLREALEKSFIGRAGIGSIYSDIKAMTKSRINKYFELKLINEYDNNIIVNVDGDVVNVEWKGAPVCPINFIFITNKFYVFKTSVNL